MNADALNKSIQGYTKLVRFNLSLDEEGQRFDLKLTLANSAGAKLKLVCRDAQNVELNPAGNGFAQVLQLQVEDMREDGLERIQFSLEEVERETLFLHCAEIAVERG